MLARAWFRAAAQASAQLKSGLRKRANSLRFNVKDYVRAIYDEDRTLEVDQGILATVLVWGPILALLIALAVTPQGTDLLDQFASDSWARAKLLAMMAVLDVVATVFSTNLIAGWFFPRVAEAAKGWFWPRIPTCLEPLNEEERWEVVRSAWLPAVVTIGLPLTFLSLAAFGWDGWWSTLVFVTSLLVYSVISVVTVRCTVRHVLTPIGASFPLLLPALSILLILGWAPVLTRR